MVIPIGMCDFRRTCHQKTYVKIHDSNSWSHCCLELPTICGAFAILHLSFPDIGKSAL